MFLITKAIQLLGLADWLEKYKVNIQGPLSDGSAG